MSDDAERVIETSFSKTEGLILRRSDGTLIGKIPISGPNPDEGSTAMPSVLFRYDYNKTNTTPPPATGQVRTDTDHVNTTTQLWVHRLDFDNRDEKFLLMGAKSGDRIYVQDMNNSDSHGFFRLESDPIDSGDYLTFYVSLVTGTGEALAGSGILLGLVS